MAPPPVEPMAYEELTSLYRNERNSNTLAELRHDFYPALAEMLARTQRDYEKALAADPDSIVCEGLNQRRKKMVDISQRIIDDRMAKIASMALKGGEGYGNTISRLTTEERSLYQGILECFRGHRSVLPPLRKRDFRLGEIPTMPARPTPEPVIEKEPDQASIGLEIPEPEEFAPMLEDEEADNMVIRVLEDLPTFSGPYRDYSLRREDVVLMPRSLAEALINRDAAVEVKPRL